MRDASDGPLENKEENKPSPKLLWSDLVEKDDDLRDALPQWYGLSTAEPKEGTQKGKMPSQPVSVESEPRLTKDEKEKWGPPTPSATIGARTEIVSIQESHLMSEESENLPGDVMTQLKQAGLVERLDSAEALIHEQQAIIDSLKRRSSETLGNPDRQV